MLGMIGKYRLDGELGRGGMGVVYKAYDTVERKTVAIKTILKGSGDSIEPYVKQFMREAEKLSLLKQENVVGFLDFGVEGELPHLVMEFVDGVKFSELLKKRKPGDEWLRKTVEMIRVAAYALEHVHKENIVHRDIKPLNIMVDFS